MARWLRKPAPRSKKLPLRSNRRFTYIALLRTLTFSRDLKSRNDNSIPPNSGWSLRPRLKAMSRRSPGNIFSC